MNGSAETAQNCLEVRSSRVERHDWERHSHWQFWFRIAQHGIWLNIAEQGDQEFFWRLAFGIFTDEGHEHRLSDDTLSPS